MNPHRNPNRNPGERNVFCSYYGDCLDDAIHKSWEFWDCARCEYRSDKGATPETPWGVSHAVAYYELPPRI